MGSAISNTKVFAIPLNPPYQRGTLILSIYKHSQTIIVIVVEGL